MELIGRNMLKEITSRTVLIYIPQGQRSPGIQIKMN
jgi:hypothetical protein